MSFGKDGCVWPELVWTSRALLLPSVHSCTGYNAPSGSGPCSSRYLHILYPDPKEIGVLYRAVLPAAPQQLPSLEDLYLLGRTEAVFCIVGARVAVDLSSGICIWETELIM